MTEARANEILRTKYPEGSIFKRNSMGGVKSSRLAVTFTKGGKVYGYSAMSYQQVLQKLGFNILYEQDVNCITEEIKRMQADIDRGYRISLYFNRGQVKMFTEEEIAEMQAKIKADQELINTAIIC